MRGPGCGSHALHVCTWLQVLDVDFAAGKATIKLVPRLDLAAMAKDHRSGGGLGNGNDRGAGGVNWWE